VEPVDGKAAVPRSCCDNERPSLHALAVAELQMARVVPAFELHRLVGNRELDAELLRLAERASHQSHSRDAGREAEVVLDPSGGTGLAAERAAIQSQDRKTLRS